MNDANKAPRRPPVTESVTMIIGGPRSFRPVFEGRAYFIAVEVRRRLNTRQFLFEYVPGWVVVEERDLEKELNEVKYQFVARQHLGHDDLPEYIRILSKAQAEITVALANAQKQYEGTLTHRLHIKSRR